MAGGILRAVEQPAEADLSGRVVLPGMRALRVGGEFRWQQRPSASGSAGTSSLIE
jgi:hypothetical protein